MKESRKGGGGGGGGGGDDDDDFGYLATSGSVLCDAFCATGCVVHLKDGR